MQSTPTKEPLEVWIRPGYASIFFVQHKSWKHAVWVQKSITLDPCSNCNYTFLYGHQALRRWFQNHLQWKVGQYIFSLWNRRKQSTTSCKILLQDKKSTRFEANLQSAWKLKKWQYILRKCKLSPPKCNPSHLDGGSQEHHVFDKVTRKQLDF